MKILAITLFGVAVLGVLSTTPAIAQVTADDVKCDGCVQSTDIATNGVRRTNIQNFAVNTPKLNNFAVTKEKIKSGAVTETKIAPEAVTTGKIKAGAVTADKIAADAVGISQIDHTQVQIRVAGSCAVGSFIAAIAEDGSVTCEKGGTVAAISASGIDLTPDVVTTDAARFWLEACLTAAYVAGPGETALISASAGLTLNQAAQGDVLIAAFVDGTPVENDGTFGAGYFWTGSQFDITDVHHVELQEGVEYRFGPTIYPQGGGLTRSRLVCQTMVQIVRVTP